MKYRAEIDGLRALAVIPVILFHAGFELFSGGFVGVDVFFVISGYLITTIIIDDIENNRFSILNFYTRRARRILPALFFVMLVCLPFAWMWMLPGQLKDFSQSLIAVSLFVSNILFWRESGYFAQAAEEKPLLHTWSLAVEEQYYVLFPIFLFLAWRFGKNRVFWAIVVMAAISLLLSEWGWRNSPTANFYLAPARAWELLAGSIAAFVARKNGIKKNDILSMIGLLAIISSIFLYDENTPFPSLYAAVPVLGVVLLILYANSETLAAKILSAKAFVGIGLISYSAYLWHQPLFAFARIGFLEHPSRALMLLLSIVSVVLAYVSWRFVEKPFRTKDGFNQRQILVFSAIGLSAFIGIGLLGHFEKITSRFQIEKFAGWEDTSECVVSQDTNFETWQVEFQDECLGEENNFILIGDSHADAISSALRESVEGSNGNLVTLWDDGCLPVEGTSRIPIDEACVRNKQKYWDFIKTTDATIIVSARWRLNLLGSRFDNMEGGVEYGKSGLNVVTESDIGIFPHMEGFLQDMAKTHKLVILNQIPEAGWDVPKRNARLQKNTTDGSEISTLYQAYLDANQPVVHLFERLSSNPNIRVIEVDKLVCNTQIAARCLNTIDGKSLYRDDDHPSPLLAALISQHLAQTTFSKQASERPEISGR